LLGNFLPLLNTIAVLLSIFLSFLTIRNELKKKSRKKR